MSWRSAALLRQLIKAREEELAHLTQRDSETADATLTVMVELMDLQNELKFVLEDPSASDEPETHIGAPRTPQPHSGCDAIALPEPDEPKF
jgi:hypothetical protein